MYRPLWHLAQDEQDACLGSNDHTIKLWDIPAAKKVDK